MLADALEHLVRGIVDHPDDVSVRSSALRRGELLEVRVHPDDLGRVIGRGGRTARALRTVVNALSRTGSVRVDVVTSTVADARPGGRVLLTVARIGRAHGLRGEVALDVRTDAPDERLAAGTVLATEPASAGPLTVVRTRSQQGRWFATFVGVGDRTAAEALRGVGLVVDADDRPADGDDEDAWYPHELVGLRAERTDGRLVGEVVGLEHAPAHDVLVVRETTGAESLVPFVRAIVPVVDVPGGRVVLDPPGGLLASDAANLVVSDDRAGERADEAGGE